MYKKKLGVRVVTAITVGSLLCSNASVAMAAEEVSSIIKEHTADEETTEAPEEKVTEAEEVVEETTEAETEEVVEETTEAETEEVVEETTEAETEEVVEETTEAEADEEELENDFEEVELEAVETPVVAETSERLLADVAAETRKVYVSLIDADDKTAVGTPQIIEIGAKDTTFPTSKLALPEEYEFAYGDGDVYVGEGDTVNVEVRKKASTEETRKVYVSLIDADDKTAVGAPQIIEIGAEDTTFHTSKLTLPEDYEFAYGDGDVYIGEGDTVNVEVRKKAEAEEKTVYVSYIDEETKMPFENGIEEIKVAADATSFNTSILTKVPAGYELCVTGDVYFGENDTVNVEVRKKAEAEEKTVYVSYIDEETKMPFENGIEAIKVAADATYFNTSILKAVPAGYELCVTGDVYFGENDTVNVEVRKKTGETPEVDEKTAVLNVTYKFGDVEVGKETVAATGEVGEAYTFTAKDLTVPAGYNLAGSFEDVVVDFGASKDLSLIHI